MAPRWYQVRCRLPGRVSFTRLNKGKDFAVYCSEAGWQRMRLRNLAFEPIDSGGRLRPERKLSDCSTWPGCTVFRIATLAARDCRWQDPARFRSPLRIICKRRQHLAMARAAGQGNFICRRFPGTAVLVAGTSGAEDGRAAGSRKGGGEPAPGIRIRALRFNRGRRRTPG